MYVRERFELSEYVKDHLRSLVPPFGYNGFGELVFYRTYSRVKADGGQESWADCVVRVIEGMLSIRKDWYARSRIQWDEGWWQDCGASLAEALFLMQWIPPGRGLWAMGTQFVYERGSMALNNCFRGTTRFLTGTGVKTLEECVGERVIVLCQDNVFRLASVRGFGKQRLQRVTLKPYFTVGQEGTHTRSNYRLTYDVTEDHRWILADGELVTDLRVGDKVKVAVSTQVIDEDSQEYVDGFAHGLIYGDGTRSPAYPNRFSIRLCDDPTRSNLAILVQCTNYRTRHQAPSYGGDVTVTIVDDSRNLKALPVDTESLVYMKGFVEGWLEADSHEKGTGVCLDSINEEGIEWLCERARLFGYAVTGISTESGDTNFGHRSKPLIRLKLARQDVVYKVADIEENVLEEEVYCVIEPETHSFTLAGGIHTGNCGFCVYGADFGADLAWMMDALMHGVGVGFKPLRDDSLELHVPRGIEDYVIPDSREGWCECSQAIVDSYVKPGRKRVRPIYDEIREANLPIKGFGGVSSGPEPLRVFHERLVSFLERYREDKSYDSVRLKADCGNATGTCVVAGNVRRCLPTGTSIFTSRGLRNIEHVKSGERVLTLSGYKRITRTFVQGPQKLVSVLLSNGQCVECTPNHKFAVLSTIGGQVEWVEASKLGSTDTLLYNHSSLSGDTTLACSVREAYFYGVLSGVDDRASEGVSYRIDATCSNGRAITDKLDEYVNELGLIRHKEIKEKGFEYKVYSSYFAKGMPSHEVPAKIYSATLEARLAYLAGLSDVSGVPTSYNLCSSARRSFLIGVQKIAASIGVCTWIWTGSEQSCLYVKGLESRCRVRELLNPICVKQYPDKHDSKCECSVDERLVVEAAERGEINRAEQRRLMNATHPDLKEYAPEFWSKVIPIRVADVVELERSELTYDVEVEGEHCFFADGVLVHNSAELMVGGVMDPVFMDLKDYEMYPDRSAWGWMSNNSVELVEDSDFDMLGEIAKRVIRNGEPGYINRQNMKYGRVGKKMRGLRKDKAIGFNPCLVGETRVLTADGRGYVPIRELAEAGQDVDVFCLGARDELCVRRMRNPRLTGEQVEVYRVTLDTGVYLDVTPGHQFMLRDRSFKEARQLAAGDQLAKLNRYIPDKRSFSGMDQYVEYSCSPSPWMRYEHHLIAEHQFGELERGDHVDHRDGDSLNNAPGNLVLVPGAEHLRSHSAGEANINFSGWSHDELLAFGVALAKRLGRRFSSKEWQRYGPVEQFSRWRNSKFGSVVQFAALCADIAEVRNDPVDTRTLRLLQAALKSGYEADLIDGEVQVLRACQSCEGEFWIPFGRREQGYCSPACSNQGRDYSKNVEGQRRYFAARREGLREHQLDVYTALKVQLGRLPLRKEWQEACRCQGVSAEIGRSGSPFDKWYKLICAARKHNYRVLFVQRLGVADVYNGTVDELHNYVIGGFQDHTPDGRLVERGIFTKNCGEQPLEDRELCTLVETCPTVCEDPQIWLQACEYATFYASTVTLLPTHQPSTNRVMSRNRRIGVGIIDFTGWKHMAGVNKVTKWMREGYERIRETNKWANEEAGVPLAIRVTTMKPGGTVPKLAGRTSGLGYPNFHYTLRRIRIAKNSPIHPLMVEAGIPYEEDVNDKFTDVFEYPILQGPAKCADQVTIWEQAMNLVLVQREWSDNAVSNTLNFRPMWTLMAHVARDFEEALAEYVGTVTACHLLWSSDKEYVVPERYKIVLRRDAEGELVSSDVYEYDPRHEEADVEAVLSAIAPLTKSVSLLPHSAKGVYPQMPEEGISPQEYKRRLSEIRPIDWSQLSGSDGMDELYCTGEACSLPQRGEPCS